MGSTNESSTPPRYEVPPGANVTDDLMERVAAAPDHAVFARKVAGGWHTVGYREFADQATALAAGLIAVGMAPGERVAILSATCYEWVLCDVAILLAGGVTVPLYETSSPEQVAWQLADSGAVGVFAGDPAQAAGASSVWSMTDGIEELTARGHVVPREDVERRRHIATAGSPATIVYTSGTTGRPKGCVITHGNLLSEVHSVLSADDIADTVITDRTPILLFLPLAHILTRVVQFAALFRGALTAHTSDLTHVVDVLADFRPTLLVAVPRVFEKVYNAAARTTGVRAAAFRVAERVALAHSHARDTGGPGVALRAAWWVFDRLVYGRLREVLGGRVRYAVSGGAPLGGGLAHFLRGAGITVLEGWGLTETTAGVTFNLPRAQRIGTVGRPLPGCAVRVAADGEVLVHGSTVFHGYWPDTTRDPDTWFHTGDLGALDDDGYLTIVGRGKDLIVTASGKNIAPEFFEGRLRAHWLVDQCVLVGDGRPYVGALFTLDPVSFAEWKSRAGRPFDATIAELRSDAQLNAVLQRAVDEVNRVVSRAEAIKRFRILADEFDVGDELTTTQNVRRNHVLAKFGTDVEALYHRPETS